MKFIMNIRDFRNFYIDTIEHRETSFENKVI